MIAERFVEHMVLIIQAPIFQRIFGQQIRCIGHITALLAQQPGCGSRAGPRLRGCILSSAAGSPAQKGHRLLTFPLHTNSSFQAQQVSFLFFAHSPIGNIHLCFRLLIFSLRKQSKQMLCSSFSAGFNDIQSDRVVTRSEERKWARSSGLLFCESTLETDLI